MNNDKNPKVLFVEDDLNLSTLFQLRMQAEGFDVTVCNDSEKALQVGRDIKPDLILLDLMMPKLDGFDVLDIFRNTLETQGAKIVVMSALSQPADIERAKSLGADEYIVKSQVDIDNVMNRLRSLMELPPSTLSEQMTA
jgi:DNA-binding response OmpR family regulator